MPLILFIKPGMDIMALEVTPYGTCANFLGGIDSRTAKW
jgi:hypothetical protein